MSKMAVNSIKPKVLWIGKPGWNFQTTRWEELGKVAEVQVCTSKNREEFIQDLKGKYSDVVCIGRDFGLSQTGRIDAELVNHFPPTLKSISNCGAGYDQIDVDPLIKRNIQLSNVTVPVEGPTADTAIFLLFSALRNFQHGHDLLMKGDWKSGKKCAGASLGHSPAYRTVGILGMGGIGRAIRSRLKPFGFKKILYYNRTRLAPELEEDSEYVSFETLLKESDILLVSVPLNKHTHHLLDKEQLDMLKNDAIVINTARGAVINEAEILTKLKNNELGFFGTDVFEFEPEVSQELLDLPNVISLPHMGTHTIEANMEMEEWVVKNIEEFLYTGKLLTPVPEVSNIDFKHDAVLTK